jgi:hypothetical protein
VGVEYAEAFKYVGYLLMALLSFLSLKLWNDVETLKRTSITKDAFDAKMDEVKAEIGTNKLEAKIDRDARASESTGNFRRLEDLIRESTSSWNSDYREISGKLTSMQVTQAAQGASLQVERRSLERARRNDEEG